MLSKKEKIISSILCVISVLLLIVSLCFTTVLFTTHGTILNAEAAPDLSHSSYDEYFSQEIFPDGAFLAIDETSFSSYSSSLGGYSAQIDLENYDYSPLRLDIAYRCVILLDDGNSLRDEKVVFFPSAYNTDGFLFYGFCFKVHTAYVRFQFLETYIQVDILCDPNYSIDTFTLSEVPSLTISSFYSSYESLAVSDGLGASTTDHYASDSLDFFYGQNIFPYLDFNYPCFLMIESNVGNLLVYYSPGISPLNLLCFRIVGIPNNFYTFCQYNEDPSYECFATLNNDTFDFDFIFEFNDVYLVAPVPLNQTHVEDDTPINESLGEVLLQGMSFGFESIGEGITYTFNTLFYDEDTGNLTTFTYVIVFTLGIGIVLGFIKWILSYIFSLGGKD